MMEEDESLLRPNELQKLFSAFHTDTFHGTDILHGSHRRTPSVISHTHSMASSQQHILSSTVMDHPNKSYLSLNPSSANHDDLVGPMTTSLSVNFLPSKFSGPNSVGIYKRKGGSVRKQGGGREAFKRGEARMPGANDDDYDGVDVRKTWFGGPGAKRTRLRWNKFKWILFTTNFLVSTPEFFWWRSGLTE